MTTAVDLSHLTPAPPRKRPPVWLTEAHPQFCATKDGCDGRHLSQVAEVDADTGQWLLVAAEMDDFGRCTVVVTPGDLADVEVRLSLDGAVAMAAQLIAKVQVARSQAAMVRPERSVAA